MRQLTAYASYHDNLGELLIGRARFCNLDGSPAQVYGLDNAHQQFISLGSTVFTNSSGQLEPQVFLDDHDYLIFFDKYIGDGTMAEDDDLESWELQGSAVDRYNTVGVELIGMTTRAISTITDLHASLPMDDGEVVLLLGYNDPGDKPPIYYKWDAASTEQDNGGSVIKVTNQERGRWVFIECPAYLDVRHFGAFPISDSISEDSQRYAIQRAGLYAHQNSCGIYFPANDAAIYYDISGLTLYDVDCNPEARVFAIDDTSATINGIVKIYCGGNTLGRIELINREVLSSWEGEYRMVTFSPTEKLIIDSQLYPLPRTFTGIQVEMHTYCGTNMVFDDCIITSNGAITGSITIKNCELKTEWFSDDYDWSDLISIGNTILLKNCKDADTYILLKNKQNENDYGDLGEQELHNAQIKGNSIIENCTGSIVVNGSGPIEMHNASVTVTGLSTANSLVLIDTWITFNENTVVSGINLWRGSITSSYYLQTIGPMYIDNADLYCQLTTLGQSPIIKNCNIYNTINATNITLTGNRIYNIIYQHEVDGVINVDVCDNYFGPNGLHSLSSSTQNTVVKGRWMNNRCGYDTNHWITIDRTNFKVNDCEHEYAYIGNEEPWMEKYTNSNSVWTLPKYRGNETDGRGIFATTTVPFLFWNTNNNNVSIVNRQFKWRMFTVGAQNTLRNGHIWVGSQVFEGEEIDTSWGKVVVTISGVKYLVLNATCVGGYEWSFENPAADHTSSSYSNGINVGHYWVPPDPTLSKWTLYPTTYWYTDFAVFIDKDFESRPPTTIQNV